MSIEEAPHDEQLADKLHSHAIEAEKHAEQLATGLAQAGTDPQAVEAVTQCAELLRKIATGLGKATSSTTQQATEAPATMDSATNDLQSQLAANRGGAPQ